MVLSEAEETATRQPGGSAVIVAQPGGLQVQAALQALPGGLADGGLVVEAAQLGVLGGVQGAAQLPVGQAARLRGLMVVDAGAGAPDPGLQGGPGPVDRVVGGGAFLVQLVVTDSSGRAYGFYQADGSVRRTNWRDIQRQVLARAFSHPAHDARARHCGYDWLSRKRLRYAVIVTWSAISCEEDCFVGNPIVIVDYDPQWAELFEEEKAEILAALRELNVTVAHIGSTAVPGLAAKPIIDIAIITANADDAVRAITPLRRLGYVCFGEADIPGRLFFAKDELRIMARDLNNPSDLDSIEHDLVRTRTHHVHLYTSSTNPDLERHFLFRDYLRAHPETAQHYAELKRALAEKYRDDRDAYTESKTPLIRDVEAQARDAWIHSEELAEKTIESDAGFRLNTN